MLAPVGVELRDESASHMLRSESSPYFFISILYRSCPARLVHCTHHETPYTNATSFRVLMLKFSMSLHDAPHTIQFLILQYGRMQFPFVWYSCRIHGTRAIYIIHVTRHPYLLWKPVLLVARTLATPRGAVLSDALYQGSAPLHRASEVSVPSTAA